MDVKVLVSILGRMRVGILAVLCGVNALLAVQIYMSIDPQLEKLDRDARIANGQIRKLRGDLDLLRQGFDVLLKQRSTYEGLEEGGFFGRQSRYEAGLVFERVQKESGVISAKATIKSGRIVPDALAEEAGHRILESDIVIDVFAIDDVDVFYYMSLLEDEMPGHLAIDKIALSRGRGLTGASLRALASGKQVPLVSGVLEAKWVTMIPEAMVLDETQDEEFGR